MKNLTVEEAAKKIRIYLNQDVFRPYFVISDDMQIFKEIFRDFKEIHISDFCAGDFLIDTDILFENLNGLTQNAVCFGLGEYIFFTGRENILRSLQDKNFNTKIIFVCRGIANLLESFADEDFKFRTNQICRISDNIKFSIVKYSPDLHLQADAENFSELLKLVEAGKFNLTVQTELPIHNVKQIDTYYDAVKNRESNFNIPSDALNDQQWREYFEDDNCDNYPADHWRSFAAGFKNKISNPYLQFVFNISTDFKTYQKNLFFALLDVDEKNFVEFYSLRKAVVKNIFSIYLAEYIDRSKNFSDAVKFLTDNTAEERQAMILAVQSKEKIPELFLKNYSAMRDYLLDFDFGIDEITTYFRQYKKIKLCNVEDENFKTQVQNLAVRRIYNRFETRQNILDSLDKNAKLYWLDALGVEFVSYIESRAKHLDLFAVIKIARADLPTLTSQNKYFYDDWLGDKFDKNQQLDDLKHSPEKFSGGKCSAPIYIDEEFAIIDGVLDEIKNYLVNHREGKVILTSDHGASRLAVMLGHENKFKMNSIGEHSGRCCLVNELDEKPACAAEENGYWVSANYDRFTGSRLSTVEVHGGATLEEILVPVIEFSLQGAKVEKVEEKISEPQKKSDDAFDFLLD